MAPKGEDKEAKVREALQEKRDGAIPRQSRRPRSAEEMTRYFETEIWPSIPEEERGQPPMPKEEVEEILGFGPDGY
jgi:hypothetical protein